MLFLPAEKLWFNNLLLKITWTYYSTECVALCGIMCFIRPSL